MASEQIYKTHIISTFLSHGHQNCTAIAVI